MVSCRWTLQCDDDDFDTGHMVVGAETNMPLGSVCREEIFS